MGGNDFLKGRVEKQSPAVDSVDGAVLQEGVQAAAAEAPIKLSAQLMLQPAAGKLQEKQIVFTGPFELFLLKWRISGFEYHQ